MNLTCKEAKLHYSQNVFLTLVALIFATKDLINQNYVTCIINCVSGFLFLSAAFEMSMSQDLFFKMIKSMREE